MIYLKKIRSLHFLTNFQLHKLAINPIISSTCLNTSTPYQITQFSQSFLRPFSVSSQLQKEPTSTEKKKTKKPLSIFFQESVGLLEKSELSESEDETDNESENKGLKCRLRKLEDEVRILQEKRKNEKANRKENGVLENEVKSKKLHELFMNEVKSRKSTPLTMDDHTVYKELSPDMVMFVTHLYKEGYFKDSNFLPRKKFDITCFENSYARDFVKYAAEQFGRDHQEIANKEEARNGNWVSENEGKSKKLHELFVNEEDQRVKSRKPIPLTKEDHTVYKELSPDVVMFVKHLYNEGYFKDSNFLPRKKFDITCFENSYARDFVKYAAEQFGRDHQEIANKEEARNGNGVSENEGKSKKLHELFVNEEVKSGKSRKSMPLAMEDHAVYKELSPYMVMFVKHLYKEGYFKDSNFLPRKKFDITCFEISYASDFVKHAAEQFGRDHQEIAKWLSGSDLKKVALFGCPSMAKKTVFSAKRLRAYFRIQEDNVCSKCALKASCKFVNQSVWSRDMDNLHLPVVMRLITLYALESVPPQLVIPDEIKTCVNRLLLDILRLSQTVC